MQTSRAFLTLMIISICLAMIAGCTTTTFSKNQDTNPQVSVTPTATYPDKALYKVTIPQPNNTHPEFIRMDADIYNQGVVIEYYLVNECSGLLSCYTNPPSFQISRETISGTWVNLPQSEITKAPEIYSLKHGESTPAQRIITDDLVPGRYKIQSTCGISRDFEVRKIPQQNLTPVT